MGATVDTPGRFTVGVGGTLVQLRANGLPNPRFSRNGRFRIARPRDVQLQAAVGAPRRRLVVAGFARQRAYVARYTISAGR